MNALDAIEKKYLREDLPAFRAGDTLRVNVRITEGEKERTQAFRYRRKQAMQLPSKTRFVAAQFCTFMEGELWREIAGHANSRADQLRSMAEGISQLDFPYPTEASCVFATIPRRWLKPLRKTRFFYVWEPQTTLVRWTMGFDTTAEDIEALCDEMTRLASPKDGSTG